MSLRDDLKRSGLPGAPEPPPSLCPLPRVAPARPAWVARPPRGPASRGRMTPGVVARQARRPRPTPPVSFASESADSFYQVCRMFPALTETVTSLSPFCLLVRDLPGLSSNADRSFILGVTPTASGCVLVAVATWPHRLARPLASVLSGHSDRRAPVRRRGRTGPESELGSGRDSYVLGRTWQNEYGCGHIRPDSLVAPPGLQVHGRF